MTSPPTTSAVTSARTGMTRLLASEASQLRTASTIPPPVPPAPWRSSPSLPVGGSPGGGAGGASVAVVMSP